MLGGINRLIIRISGNAWLFIVTAVIAFGCLAMMTKIGDGFPAVSGGARPFDLQNGLTAGEVLQQLAGYTDEARRQYLVFTTLDYVFPFAAGLFLAAIGTFCLRHGFPAAYAKCVRSNLLPLFLAGTLFDWCENVAALTAIMTYPGTPAAVASALVLAKHLKLICVVASQGLVLLLLLATAFRLVSRRLASSSAT